MITIDDKTRQTIEQKLKGMDYQYWMTFSCHLSALDKELNVLLEEQKQAFVSYFVSCFNIAETKYLGYRTLLEDASSEDEEKRIENEFKDKLDSMTQEQQRIVGQISCLQNHLYEFTRRRIPPDRYLPEQISG